MSPSSALRAVDPPAADPQATTARGSVMLRAHERRLPAMRHTGQDLGQVLQLVRVPDATGPSASGLSTSAGPPAPAAGPVRLWPTDAAAGPRRLPAPAAAATVRCATATTLPSTAAA